MIARARRLIASLLIVSIAGIGLPLPAHAGIVSTDAALASAERDRIASMLERADVRAQLEAYGVRAADVKARVAALTTIWFGCASTCSQRSTGRPIEKR